MFYSLSEAVGKSLVLPWKYTLRLRIATSASRLGSHLFHNRICIDRQQVKTGFLQAMDVPVTMLHDSAIHDGARHCMLASKHQKSVKIVHQQ
jgi:hypothetical protein